MVGSAEEVASEIMEYKAIGISQFLFTGWPDEEEMRWFADYLLPAIREREREEDSGENSLKEKLSGSRKMLPKLTSW